MARLFAAAYFPLTPPILRLIQETVTPGGAPHVIAEVLLSGLMRRFDAPGVDPEQTRYQIPDELREPLLDGASATDMLHVLRTDLSKYIDSRFGNLIDFRALLADPDAVGELLIAETQEPMARLGVSILRRLGGKFADLGQKIEARFGVRTAVVAPVDVSPFREWSALHHPRRPRVELAAYLGVPEAIDAVGVQGPPEDFTEFLRGLRRWGLPVLIRATLEASGVTPSAPERRGMREQILTLGEACLERRSATVAEETERAIAAYTRSSWGDIGAALAAQVAVVAFKGVNPSGDATEEAAATAAVAILGDARRAGVSTAHLRNGIRDMLLTDLLSETSLVPDRLGVRATVLVAGICEFHITDLVGTTAAALGQTLARTGHRLIVGGGQGVDHVVARSFVRELEILGQHVDSRRDKGTAAQGDRIVQLLEADPGSTERPNFDGGVVEHTRNWIRNALSRSEALITISGFRAVPEIIRGAEAMGIPVYALPWTGEASARHERGRGVLRGRMTSLDEPEVSSAEDVQMMVDRVMSLVRIGTDAETGERWKAYNNSLYSLLRAYVPRHLEVVYPRFRELIRNLELEKILQGKGSKEELFGLFAELAPQFPRWATYDFLQLSELETGIVEERHFPIGAFATLVRELAEPHALFGLSRRLADLAAPIPRRPIDLLPVVAREFFSTYEALDRWTKDTAGMDADECFFRASIPLAAYRAAMTYVTVDHSAERHVNDVRFNLGDLAPRREYVRRFADSTEPAARVMAYVLMHLYDLGIGPVELISRIHAEVERLKESPQPKPLRQLLFATSRIVEVFDASGKRMIARALKRAADEVPAKDPMAGAVAYLLGGQLLAAAAENDTIDDEAMSFPSWWRSVLSGIRNSAKDLEFSASELEYLFRTGTDNQRLLALSIAPSVNGRTPFEAVREGLEHSKSEREFLLALGVAESLSRRLTHSQLSALVDAAVARRVSMSNQKGLKQLESVTAKLKDRRDAVDRVRYAPVAVIGSDTSGGVLREFCRELGERLAMMELGVVTANPLFASWLAEGYRMRSPQLDAFVVLRSASDTRPRREGVNYRMVDAQRKGTDRDEEWGHLQDLTALSEELINEAKGVLFLGGGSGAFKEYELARRKGLPIVAIPCTKGAAAEVANASLARLERWGVAPAIVNSLHAEQPSARLAAVAGHAMTQAILWHHSEATDSSDERNEAAQADLQRLLAVVRKRTEASSDTLVHAEKLISFMGKAGAGWKEGVNTLRHWDKHVMMLAQPSRLDPYVAELVSRSTYAVCAIELAIASRHRAALAGAAAQAALYDRVSAAPVVVLEQLRDGLLQARGAIPQPRIAVLTQRLGREIGSRISGIRS
ncbi:MAG: hypothetical protein ABI779_17385 [Acidobacteriota bacterium]